MEGRADGIVYGKFQPDLPAATESVLQPEMEFAAEIPPEEEISFIDEIKGVYRNVAAMEQPVYVHKARQCAMRISMRNRTVWSGSACR